MILRQSLDVYVLRHRIQSLRPQAGSRISIGYFAAATAQGNGRCWRVPRNDSEAASGIGDDGRTLVKYDSPGFSITLPDGTAERASGPIGGKRNIGGDSENPKIGNFDSDARRGQHLGDNIALGIDTPRASEFHKLVRDESIERVGGRSDFRTQEAIF